MRTKIKNLPKVGALIAKTKRQHKIQLEQDFLEKETENHLDNE
jgi:hypothetical protein